MTQSFNRGTGEVASIHVEFVLVDTAKDGDIESLSSDALIHQLACQIAQIHDLIVGHSVDQGDPVSLLSPRRQLWRGAEELLDDWVDGAVVGTGAPSDRVGVADVLLLRERFD
jgi:hypothetical protein